MIEVKTSVRATIIRFERQAYAGFKIKSTKKDPSIRGRYRSTVYETPSSILVLLYRFHAVPSFSRKRDKVLGAG